MPVTMVERDILKEDVDVLVNPVNVVGAMGLGLALQFRWRFPDMYERYRVLCFSRKFKVDQLWVYRAPNGQRVVCFPTKQHWQGKTKLEWIESNLLKLASWCQVNEVASIAVPPLGCGAGGLEFDVVRDLIYQYLDHLETDVRLCVHKGNYFKQSYE